MDVNNIFFSRFAPAKKMEMLNSLSETDLLNINADAIKRMVVETGSKYEYGREWQKNFGIKAGNDWNAEIVCVEAYVKRIMLNIYVQYENTDTNVRVNLNEFMARGDYKGSFKGSDRYGNERTYYFTFTPSDKANFVRSLIKSYLRKKYADKL